MSSSKVSFPREKIKILLLENVHPEAVERLKDAGYSSIKHQKAALSEPELEKALKGIHILGIRSKTEVTERIIKASPQLLSVGCFCIGTNQVEVMPAALAGVPVFNAPFSNTRSVAELTMAEIVMLARKASHKSDRLHKGIWDKSATACFEVRNKTLGIIGYGHIGGQVGLLAEAFGMRVVFYDVIPKLALGNAQQLRSLKEVLSVSQFVTLHVPENPTTKNMIGAQELAAMKKGSYLINLSRGTVVDIKALAASLKSGHLGGAGVDVFPEEPESNDQPFTSPLCGLDNVILTPHIGGSTEEAQKNIAIEVAQKLIRYSDTGSTTGAVNFPEVELPLFNDSHRILNIHKNVPGVLRDINRIIAEMGGNIRAQYLSTQGDVGYLIIDIDQAISHEVKIRLEKLDTNIRTRILF